MTRESEDIQPTEQLKQYGEHSTTIEEQTDYYDIHPTSIADVKKQLVDKTPVFMHGSRFMAKTILSLKTGFNGMITPEGVAVKNIQVSLKITYVMPRLVEGCCSADIVNYFDALYDKLKLHEDGHGNIGKESIPEIIDYVMDTPAQKDFETLTTFFYQRKNFIFDKAEQRSTDYDLETNHGKTQGAYI